MVANTPQKDEGEKMKGFFPVRRFRVRRLADQYASKAGFKVFPVEPVPTDKRLGSFIVKKE